ncbi:MAG: TPD domain-containing protein [Candidatus Altiarchaeota archaeon]
MMNSRTYSDLYNQIESLEGLEGLSRKFEVDRETLEVIYTQKVIRETKQKYYSVQKKIKDLAGRWYDGESLFQISKSLDFSPVLTASIVLQSLGVGKKEVQAYMRDPSSISNLRIRSNIKECITHEFVYSPAGNRRQTDRGKRSEEAIKNWLLRKKIGFMTEKEAQRKNYEKTPDFLLEGSLNIDGHRANWVESKASFGDRKEVQRDYEKQLKHYVRLFGPGMTIYWYGLIDDIVIEDSILLRTRDVLERH